MLTPHDNHTDAALDIPPNATQDAIRTAYKKQALKHHPDRVPADSPDRPTRTRKFQQINDAYYTLSEPSRRSDYDATRRFHNFPGAFSGSGGSSSQQHGYETADEEVPRAEGAAAGSSSGFGFGGGFPWSAFGFGGQAKSEEEANKFSNEQFGGVFEEMLRYLLSIPPYSFPYPSLPFPFPFFFSLPFLSLSSLSSLPPPSAYHLPPPLLRTRANMT